jgi:hypothetical protein
MSNEGVLKESGSRQMFGASTIPLAVSDLEFHDFTSGIERSRISDASLIKSAGYGVQS